MLILRGCAWLSDLLEIIVFPSCLPGFDFHVEDFGKWSAFTAKNAETDQVGLFAFGFDMDTTLVMVVLHIALDVAVQGIAVHITPETDIEDFAVNSYGVGYHAAKLSLFLFVGVDIGVEKQYFVLYLQLLIAKNSKYDGNKY